MPRVSLVCVLIAACSAGETKRTPAKLAHPAGALEAPGLRLPQGVTPLAYELRLELDPDSESFTGQVQIRTRLDVAADHIWIHADDLAISTARFDGGTLTALPVEGDQMRAFGFGRTIGPSAITLSFQFAGHTTKDEEGLFRQRAGDRWYLFSQGESVFARRITPCFDEPRFKTPWKVTLVVPGDLVALGNTASVRETKIADGRREIELAETPLMPSYLLALAVGPFELVDAGKMGRDHVPVRVATLHGDRDRVGVVAAQLPGVIDALESYLDSPLPWPKLDLVAVPHLFGAMENPGLITFDAPILVGDSRRRTFRRRFLHIAAHEIAHQWFGNLVTPAWWDDLWLSESFASWLSDKVAIELGAFDDAQLREALQREQALEADAEPDAKPLRHAVARNDDPDTAFDAIAYEKGAAVLAMFERWIGEAKLQSALREYLRAHRNATAVTGDMIAAIAAVSSPEVARAFTAYVDDVGAPVVELALDCQASPPRVIAHARTGTVPVCIRSPAGRSCELVGNRTELPFEKCPAWIIGNAGAGYYHLVSTIPAPAIEVFTPAERIARGDDVVAGLARGDLAIKAALVELAVLAKASDDPYALHAAAAIAHAIDPLVDDATRPAWSKWLARRFAAQLEPRPLPLAKEVAARQVREDLVALIADQMSPGASFEARNMTARILDSKDPELDPDLVAISHDAALFDQIAALAGSSTDEVRDAAFESLGRFDVGQIDRAFDLVLATDAPVPVAWPAIAGFFERGATRTAAWKSLRARVPKLLARLTGVQAGMVVEITAVLCDRTSRDEVAATFEPHVSDVFDGRRLLDHSLSVIDRCIARRTRAGDIAGALH